MGDRIAITPDTVGTFIPEIPHRLTLQPDALTAELWSACLRWCESNTTGRWGAYVETLFSLITTDVRFELESDVKAFSDAFPVVPLADTPDRGAEFDALLKGVFTSTDPQENRKTLLDRAGGRRAGISVSIGKRPPPADTPT